MLDAAIACLHWVTKSISLGQILDLLNAKALKSKCMVISLCGGCDIYYKWSLSSNFMSLCLCTYKNTTSYIKLSWFLRNSTHGSNLIIGFTYITVLSYYFRESWLSIPPNFWVKAKTIEIYEKMLLFVRWSVHSSKWIGCKHLLQVLIHTTD